MLALNGVCGAPKGDAIARPPAIRRTVSTTVDTVPAGTICAVTGLTQTFPGEGLGMERDAGSPVLQPVLTYTLEPGECDIHKCLVALRELEDEDPLLHVVWQSRLEEVHLQLMGAVQLEIIQQIMHDRFGLDRPARSINDCPNTFSFWADSSSSVTPSGSSYSRTNLCPAMPISSRRAPARRRSRSGRGGAGRARATRRPSRRRSRSARGGGRPEG